MFLGKIAIDLGTCNSLVFIPRKGIILNEPSVIAIIETTKEILAVGNEAKLMIGRTPETITVYRPLKEGVIADYRATRAMLKYFIQKAQGRFNFLKPELLVSVPAGASSTEKRAVIEAALSGGAKKAFVVTESIAAAIGAGIPIQISQGNLVIDIGGGTTDIAIICLGGIVTSNSIRIAGDRMDLTIADYLKRKHNLAVGIQTAEEIKKTIGTAIRQRKEEFFDVRGRDLISGLPKNIKISSNELVDPLRNVLMDIIEGIKYVLRKTPAELSADIMAKGMILTGGGALLRNLDRLIAQHTGVPCFLAEDSFYCVIKGLGVVLENLEAYKKSLITKK